MVTKNTRADLTYRQHELRAEVTIVAVTAL